MNSDRENLILQNIKLVYFVYGKYIKKSQITLDHREDLISNGMVGLIKAIDNFEADKRISFSSFACTCIYNEMTNYILKEYRNDKKTISLLTPIGNNLTIEDVLSDEIKIIETQDDIKKLPFYKNLSAKQAFICKKFAEGFNENQIAKKMGISKQSVNAIKKQIRIIIQNMN